MTWHGPGQSVAYAICDLRPGRRVRALRGGDGGGDGRRGRASGRPAGADAMGLYAGGRKLGSVGIRVREGITTHGLALNRDPDLDWFRLMTACGAPGVEATSIAAEGGDPSRERVDRALAEGSPSASGWTSRPPCPTDLTGRRWRPRPRQRTRDRKRRVRSARGADSTCSGSPSSTTRPRP